ncbi:hypothetical protein V5O48_018784 [Marasmius crinis-equi]|uniref:Uncharacterized protein n=1 Tax=Marasmius crinis-equi TaxID=585013 RepID=A0ABR3EKA3_9AGAR
MKKKNFKRHCSESTGHREATERATKRKRVEEIEQQQYTQLFHTSPIPLVAPPISCQPSQSRQEIPSYIEQEHAAAFENEWDALTPAEINSLFPVGRTEEEAQHDIESTVNREMEQFIEDMIYEEVYSQDELNIDVDETDQITEDLQGMGLSNEQELLQQLLSGVSPNDDFYPYPNATVCYLDVFDNFYRQRHSEAVMKSVLWLLNKTGVKDVPSYYEFRKIQQEVRNLCAAQISDERSDLGNVFSSISVADLAARDFANPLVAPSINLYPEDVQGRPISEMWQVPGGRWTEVPQDLLPPSVLVENKRHYIHELAELTDGQWVLPQFWVTVSKEPEFPSDTTGFESRSHSFKELTKSSWLNIAASNLTVSTYQFIK